MLDTRVVQERIESRDVEQLAVLVKLQYTLSREMQRLQKRTGNADFTVASNLLLKDVFEAVVHVMGYSSERGQGQGTALLLDLKRHSDNLWRAWKRGCGKVAGTTEKSGGSAENSSRVQPTRNAINRMASKTHEREQHARNASKDRRGTTLGNFFKTFSGAVNKAASSFKSRKWRDVEEVTWEDAYRQHARSRGTVYISPDP
jgi:hypothetical protein